MCKISSTQKIRCPLTLQHPYVLSMSAGARPDLQTEAENHNTSDFGSEAGRFRKNWQAASADSSITLYGFRRFKTSHLLNLRFLEDEIAELDHMVYQAGLTLGIEHAPANRLGLNYCKRDRRIPAIRETITHELVLRLRDLLKQYGLWPYLFKFEEIDSLRRLFGNMQMKPCLPLTAS